MHFNILFSGIRGRCGGASMVSPRARPTVCPVLGRRGGGAPLGWHTVFAGCQLRWGDAELQQCHILDHVFKDRLGDKG
jgi:hypothetical protein